MYLRPIADTGLTRWHYRLRMAFTPLHRELGLEASDLTHEVLQSAIEQRVREQDDLDWKKTLPVRERHEEFAKDVAAMANSGGGLLVFGVEESKDGTSAAGSLAHIEKWDDAEQRRLRQVAYSAIQPPVHGLTFHDLKSDGVRTVVLEVPASADAPHLVWIKERFAAPLRYGAQTEYMNERQLETAYSSRRQMRSDLLARLQDTAANAVTPVATDGQVWLSITATPAQPRPTYSSRVTSEEFTGIILAGAFGNPFVVHASSGPMGVSPRPRYRRWTNIDSYEGVAERVTEIHDDGTLVYALALHPVKDGARADLHPMALHDVPAEAVWLLRHVNAALTPGSEYVLRVNLHSDFWPVYFRTFSTSTNHLDDRDNPILRFEPVEVTVDPQASKGSLLELIWAIVTDIVNQGGTRSPSATYLKRPSEG